MVLKLACCSAVVFSPGGTYVAILQQTTDPSTNVYLALQVDTTKKATLPSPPGASYGLRTCSSL